MTSSITDSTKFNNILLDLQILGMKDHECLSIDPSHGYPKTMSQEEERRILENSKSSKDEYFKNLGENLCTFLRNHELQLLSNSKSPDLLVHLRSRLISIPGINLALNALIEKAENTWSNNFSCINEDLKKTQNNLNKLKEKERELEKASQPKTIDLNSRNLQKSVHLEIEADLLISRITKLYSEENIDITFHCQDGWVDAHKLVFRGYPNSFLSKKVNSNNLKDHNHINTGSYPTESIKLLLEFLYLRKQKHEIALLCNDQLLWMLNLTDFLCLEDLHQRCSEILTDRLKKLSTCKEIVTLYYTKINIIPSILPDFLLRQLNSHLIKNFHVLRDLPGHILPLNDAKLIEEKLRNNPRSSEEKLFLGLMYVFIFDTKTNLQTAIDLFEAASKDGVEHSESMYGYCLLEGSGRIKNQKKAVEILQKQSENKNDYFAKTILGAFLSQKDNTDEQVKGNSLLIDAVKYDFAEAQYQFGKLCTEGRRKILHDEKKACKHFEIAAEQGHRESQYLLGLYHKKRAKSDLEKEVVFKWLEKAAKNQHPLACLELGKCYFDGFGVKQNLEKAFIFFDHASEQKVVEADFYVGLFYLKGYGMDIPNPELGVSYIKSAAKQNHSKAKLHLSECLFNGIGIKQNEKNALELLITTAKSGDSEAQYILAIHYLEKEHLNKKEAIYWLEKSVANNNYDAYVALGVYLNNENDKAFDPDRAFRLFLTAHNNKNVDGTFRIAQMYYNNSNEKDNLQLSEDYFLMIRDIFPEAYYYLGMIDLKNEPPKLDSAIKKFKIGAKKGCKLSQFKLGKILIEETLLPRDDEKAFSLFKKSVKNGNIDSNYYLGLCYLNGWGTKINIKKSIKHFTISSENGFGLENAKMNVWNLLSNPDPSIREAAEEFLDKFTEIQDVTNDEVNEDFNIEDETNIYESGDEYDTEKSIVESTDEAESDGEVQSDEDEEHNPTPKKRRIY